MYNTRMVESRSREGRFAETVTYDLPQQGFFMQLTRPGHDLLKRAGLSNARSLVASELAGFLADPFGETSIDRDKDSDAGRFARIVHRFSDRAEALFGVPIAVKGTGLDTEYANRILIPRMEVSNQFVLMNHLHKTQKRLFPDGIDGRIFINEPYGLIAHEHTGPSGKRRRQEWMLMERVVDASPVHQTWNSGSPEFSVFEYPDLAAFVRNGDEDKYKRIVIPFAGLEDRIIDCLGVSRAIFEDLSGDNILHQTLPDGTSKYTIIDIQSFMLMR